MNRRRIIFLIIIILTIGYTSAVTILDINESTAIGFDFDDVNNINKYNSNGKSKMEFDLEIENVIIIKHNMMSQLA